MIGEMYFDDRDTRLYVTGGRYKVLFIFINYVLGENDCSYSGSLKRLHSTQIKQY